MTLQRGRLEAASQSGPHSPSAVEAVLVVVGALFFAWMGRFGFPSFLRGSMVTSTHAGSWLARFTRKICNRSENCFGRTRRVRTTMAGDPDRRGSGDRKGGSPLQGCPNPPEKSRLPLGGPGLIHSVQSPARLRCQAPADAFSCDCRPPRPHDVFFGTPRREKFASRSL